MAADPRRVLLVAPSTRMTGGQAVQAALLTSHLEQAGVAVELLPIDLPLPAWLARLPGARTAARWMLFNLRLWRRVWRCDVVHAFSASYLSFWLWPAPAIIAGRLTGKRTFLNYRSGEAPDHLARSGRLVRPLCRLATAVVTPSGYLQAVFAQHGIRAVVVPNIVDVGRFHYRERRDMRPVVLVARVLEPLYNNACAIRAFGPVKAAWPAAELWITGEGSDRPALERLIEETGVKGVRLLGRVPHDEMPALYDRADLLLNTPNLDNMPVSLLEAFASGLPVVSTEAGGIPWIVDHGRTGLLAPVNDDGALAGHLLRLLDNQEEARALARAAHEECARYRGEQVAAAWLALYQGEA